MRLFGKAKKALNAVGDGVRGGWHRILESFPGAWQRNIEEKRGDLLCYPTLFACVTRVSKDIGKLPFKVVAMRDGIFVDQPGTKYAPVLKKPNHYQTAQQFRENWVSSLLTDGNTYGLKERNGAGDVIALYVLDPERVRPLVSDSGEVYYELALTGWNNIARYPQALAVREGNLVVPASEVIHDRYAAIHHPLIGVPPLCAAHWPAVKNLKILRNSAAFFNNGAQASGILTAPAGMSEKDADEVKKYWNENFSGDNSGKVAVIGADMKYTAFSMKAIDSQMVEQMKYSDEQICQAFGIKPYKIGIGVPPGGWKSDDVNVEYYGDALSPIIESMENLLDEGLGVTSPACIEIDTAPLWRMDEGKQAEVQTSLVSGKIKTPDEARQTLNLPATWGGDAIYGQHQDYPLGMLRDRNDLGQSTQVPPVEPEQDESKQVEAFFALLEKELKPGAEYESLG